MSERSVWQGLGEAILGRKGAKAGTPPLTTIEQRCPVCRNAQDPGWLKCPYCDAKKNAGDKTSRVAEEPADAQGPRRATRVDTPVAASATVVVAAGSGRGQTQVDHSPADSPIGPSQTGGGRRLTGVVTTFTWSRLGQLFEVRDARNYVGSGNVSAENNRRSDIHVPEDTLLSSAHFLILCQGSKYIISDLFSTNGTFVNDVQIDTRGIDLPDDAVIKAGGTVFKFQKIHAPRVSASTAPPPDSTEPPPDSTEPPPDDGPGLKRGGRPITIVE